MCTDTNVFKVKTRERRFTVTISGKPYTINGQITPDDLELYSRKKGTTTSEQILAEIVSGHVKNDDKPSIEEIIHSEAIGEFIHTVCSSETGIGEKCSEHTDIEDPCERFLISANEYFWELMRQLPERLKNSFDRFGANIAEATADYFKALGTAQYYSFITQGTQDAIRSIAETAANSISAQILTESTSQVIASIINEHQKLFREFTVAFYDSLPLYAIKDYPKERVEEICEALRTWGDYGWTIPDQRKIMDLFTEPVDKAQADKTAMSYCDANRLESIFDETFKLKKVRRIDFQEAIDNYKDRRYKSCAMILFALIEAFFIRKMPKPGTGKRGRPVGHGAVEKAKEKIDEKKLAERYRIGLFRFENLFACLLKMFEKTDDFKSKKDVINRNYLDHGMMTGSVRKRDCIQLFLLYYNLLDFYENEL